MNISFKQTGRLGRLTTSFGGDTLVLLRFDGTDYLNDLFEYRVEALATRNDLDFDALIGTPATVEIESADGPRPFCGIVTSARWMGAGENGHRYDLTLRPWFWLAGRRRNQRIFHDKTVVDILTELLKDYETAEGAALTISLTQDYPVLEYTVQYGESDLDFARRMMERFGISFHFQHAAGTHSLVLTDDALTHPSIGTRPLRLYDGQHQGDAEHLWEWAPERNLTTGAIRLTDYDFKQPRKTMRTEFEGDAAHANGQIESFDYPGDYLDEGRGRIVARLRTAQERGLDRRSRALGDCVSLSAGLRLTLGGEQVPGSGESYLCLSASHHFVSEGYGTGGGQSDGYAFTGRYVLMPDTAPLAPPRRTPLARVQGPQTAEVVGSDEVDCDEYGRILVRFHWDLDGDNSMRCRVSQSWAGPGWGGMVIPRIGMEVVVEFLEGDPDKPLVTGCVYNGANPPPAGLPANKSRSVFKTKSYQGTGFNELTFEDRAGDEFIYLHAQKNLDVHVQNSRQMRVEYDDNQTIGNNSNLAVAANRTETVDGARDVTVKGSYAEKTQGGRGIVAEGGLAMRSGEDLTLKAAGEIVIDARKITLVAGGAALVLQGGAVNIAPVLNVGSASPGAAALPAIPAVLKAAAGEGSPFVSHCPASDA